jgi:uncharacterized membrane protein YhaH (DUF805 family)
MFTSISHHLRRIARFSGRESRGLFWPYAGCILLLLFLVWCVAIVSQITTSMGRMQRFATEHPDQATVVSHPGTYSISISGYHPGLTPDFGQLITLMALLVVLVIVLLAAAVSRRLHDRGRSALWGLLPLPFLAIGLVGFGKLLASVGTGASFNIGLFFALFLNNILYLAALMTLVIQLASGGTPGPNKFGNAEGWLT